MKSHKSKINSYIMVEFWKDILKIVVGSRLFEGILEFHTFHPSMEQSFAL